MNSKLTPLKTIITGKTLRIIHPISRLLFIEFATLTKEAVELNRSSPQPSYRISRPTAFL